MAFVVAVFFSEEGWNISCLLYLFFLSDFEAFGLEGSGTARPPSTPPVHTRIYTLI